MSRNKKGAASEGNISAQQGEAAVNPLSFSIEKLLRELLKENKGKAIKEMKEDIKKLNNNIQALELKQQQTPPAGNAGSQ